MLGSHLGTGWMQFNSSQPQPTSQAQPTTPNSHMVVGSPGSSLTTQASHPPLPSLSLLLNNRNSIENSTKKCLNFPDNLFDLSKAMYENSSVNNLTVLKRLCDFLTYYLK
ncbi:hypothetical protein J6590_034311 [Homalodisca vitripennis]|nr:hypothetical protein J6590_034311 [Homalodisca vitripennis]